MDLACPVQLFCLIGRLCRFDLTTTDKRFCFINYIDHLGHAEAVEEKVRDPKLTPEENQSPSGVGVINDFMASTIDTAVDAADDLPHFCINTPPLCKSNIYLFNK